MYRIIRRRQLTPLTFQWDVEARDVARAARPGHFLMVRLDETGERIPLTVADSHPESGIVTVVVQAVGKTTHQMMAVPEGAEVLDFVGPLGEASDITSAGRVVLVGGGIGIAPLFPILRAHNEHGNATTSIIGFRTREFMFWHDRFTRHSDELIVTTDDGSFGQRGLVTAALQGVLDRDPDIDLVVCIGPLVMMRAVAEITRPAGVRTLVSLNSIMVDGTGMCGSCRVSIEGEMKFACVDGPDFDGHLVDFDELLLRQKRFEREEHQAMERFDREAKLLAGLGGSGRDPALAPSRRRAAAHDASRTMTPERVPLPPGDRPTVKKITNVAPHKMPMPQQPATVRVGNFDEVTQGYNLDLALAEADRCLQCKKPRCVPGCPVGIDIPAFIGALARRDLRESYRILKDANTLPAVCGRVCPQETQCEVGCILTKKVDAVAIGRLERFVADAAAGQGWDRPVEGRATTHRVAVVGAGPAGLACAGDLARAGVDVTVYEALHVPGGVLKYGIPEFRLPNEIIDIEIDALRQMGVKIQVDAIVGKVFTLPQLMGEMGFDAVFVATGAGSPRFMNIPGEALNGVFSANEFLTRVNLMQGFRQPLYDTPVGMGRDVVVVGAGNTAMDAARVALRMGADSVRVVYRRSRFECPARSEEVEHAIEEGVVFEWLTNPVKISGSEAGWAAALTLVRMELGTPDDSGRRRPVPVPGTEFESAADTVIVALGTQANPVIAQTTPNLETNRWGYILADDETGATNIPGVYAGGDIVTGSATVILAMGAGRRAARAMLQHLASNRSADGFDGPGRSGRHLAPAPGALAHDVPGRTAT